MAELENSRDLISVLWSGADILRSKMDANEYKDYLLGIVFYKYLSDSFLIKAYDLIYDEKPQSLKAALETYREALEDESAEELKEQVREECHYVLLSHMTGILPIAKYSSGLELNMFSEFTMGTEERFAEYFGFTEEQTDQLFIRYQQKNGLQSQVMREGLKNCYGGYHAKPEKDYTIPVYGDGTVQQ